MVPGDWLKSVPVGMRKLLNWVKSQYNNPLVYITENGVDDPTGELDDQFRVGYIRNYTNEVLKGKFADWGWEIHESKPLVHHVNCKKTLGDLSIIRDLLY